MARVKIGIGLPNQIRDVNPTVIPQWAVQAEDAGFSTLGTVGRQAYPSVTDTVALAAAAAVTSKIGLMSTVLLAATWPATLMAKELAGIDGISGHRLTVGIGSGGRPDDFIPPEYGMRGRGERLDRDLETYREVWQGEPFGGGTNPAVPTGTRQIPMLFGGFAPAVMERMARWGEGYIGGPFPAEMTSPSFEAAKAAWTEAGREGGPRLVALPYFALGDPDKGRANIGDYYDWMGAETAGMVARLVCGTADEVKAVIDSFTGIGADEIIFTPATDDADDVKRLAEIVF
jgi:alkanesulfonate monooxygenase SsuD/methylene tetrahydromethanopterin reductase-like flavin-dependent oxidoreductase (luciferase family)